MPPEPPITDLFKKLHRPDDAYADIYNHFSKKAHEIAKSRLGDKLKDRTSPTSIAHAALQETLEATSKVAFPSRNDFERLLRKHVKQCIADVDEAGKTQMRDLERQVSADQAAPPVSSTPTPAQLAASGDFAVQYVNCLFEEETEIKRTIVLLGIAQEHSASQIRRMLESHPEAAEEIPSQRAIQLIVKKRKQILAERLFGVGLDEFRERTKRSN